jgi:hypothetical protein
VDMKNGERDQKKKSRFPRRRSDRLKKMQNVLARYSLLRTPKRKRALKRVNIVTAQRTMAPATFPSDHEEYQYLNLISHILTNGEHRPDR